MQKLTVTLVLMGLCACKTSQQKPNPLVSGAAKPEPAAPVALPPIPDTPSEETIVAAHQALEVSSPLAEFGAIYFGFDSAELTDEDCERLDELADYLVAHQTVAVRIEGHADDRGTSEYNLALGERRAHAIEAYLALLGVGEHQLFAVSYGEEQPAYFGSEEETWAMNRRGELIEVEAELLGAITD
ncbi:MAG: OmpA family protein [Myxococcota bacterium]